MKPFLQAMAFFNRYGKVLEVLPAILEARGALRASIKNQRKIVIVVDDAQTTEEIMDNVRVQLDAGIIDRF